ncbi:hypothetical protein N7509_000296 [Penicillium cosmopolitanum]|uniref:Uncharacterized protein n=1 Tax=Penicillium cosmopolitanum TaxID=1131564 RepID=A0A9W9WAQ4_9EURO|nr:uncharacterized protein N7509_000296 [Penicillium cosmopolitanum]KAJ5413669.1 hypothetical protein N7509_000296 [Penicillium cosmopolitanum]
MALFREYVPIAFTKDGAQARSILSSRWNQLMVEVKECMAAEIGLESKIDGLAQCKVYKRAAYKQNAHLIDPTGGYQAYRSGMGGSHALHFLLPALTAFARKDSTIAEVVPRDLSLYIETYCCPTCETHVNHMVMPETYGYMDCVRAKEDSPPKSSFLAILTACFRC